MFPEFHGSPTIVMGEHGRTYALDGVMLRALMAAANDFIPPAAEPRLCWASLEAQEFQVIRQAGRVFVSIYVNPGRCGYQVTMLDAGAKYAISEDGRILRRVLGSETGAPATAPNSDAGKVFREPGLSTVLKPPGYDMAPHLPPAWRGGGSGVDGGSAPDGGVLTPVDAGF